MEEWKDIKGFEGKYKVGSEGHVLSLDYRHTGQAHILTPSPHISGNLRIQLHDNGKRKFYWVKRLVAEYFVPNPNNLPEVKCKDGNMSNVSADNLKWCTRSEARSTPYQKEMVSKKLGKPVYCVELNRYYDSARKASIDLKLSHSAVCRCSAGKQPTAGGYHFIYVNKDSL